MPKVYKTLADTIPDLESLATTDEKVLFIVTNELLKDSNKQGIAPKQDGFLVNSSILNSLLEDGLIIYATPYARKLYFEGSITGILMWVDKTAIKNKEKFRKILFKAVDEKKKNIFN